MAMTKKKQAKDTALDFAESNYASATIKGKGPSKKQAIKASMKNEGGLGSKKKKR